MWLDISAGAKQKQKQQEYTKQSLAQGVEKKNQNTNLVVINKKPWKASRKVTFSSGKSKIKSHIGIIPLKKQETTVKKNKE